MLALTASATGSAAGSANTGTNTGTVAVRVPYDTATFHSNRCHLAHSSTILLVETITCNTNTSRGAREAQPSDLPVDLRLLPVPIRTRSLRLPLAVTVLVLVVLLKATQATILVLPPAVRRSR